MSLKGNKQEEILKTELRLAKEYNKAVVLHWRAIVSTRIAGKVVAKE